MKYLGKISDSKDIVTKEYVDNKVSNIPSSLGKIYHGSIVTNTVADRTSVIVNELYLPAGKYILTFNVEFSISSTASTVVNIMDATGILAIERSTMSGGGGNSLCAVINNQEEEGYFKAYAYQNSGKTVTLSKNMFKAVKVG